MRIDSRLRGKVAGVAFATIGLMQLACVAFAGTDLSTPIPSPLTSTVPPVIRLVGLGADGLPSAGGSYSVIVRNTFSTPLAGYLVILTFANCGASKLASSGYPPGLTVDCRPDRRTVRRITDANGQATFIVPGAVLAQIAQGAACMNVSSEGVSLANVSATSADLDAQGGVGANDLAEWLNAFGTQSLAADYDGNGAVDANDLSTWLTVFGSSVELLTPAAFCP
jgi:hypothetical protein